MPGFRLRLMALLAGLVLVVVATSGILAEQRLRERQRTELEQSLRERATLVRELVGGRALVAADLGELDGLADQAGAAAAARVTLIAANGTVVGDSEVGLAHLPDVESHATRPEVIEAHRQGVGLATRLSDTVGRRFLYLAIPADGAGTVRLAVPLDDVDAAVADLRRLLLLAGAVGLAAALVLSFPLSALTVRPVREIQDVVSAIAEGKLERRLSWQARDELGAIAGSVNRMAEQLRDRLDAATAERDQLEAVLASMLDGVLVLERGRVVLANPRARELFSAWGEVEGRRPLEVIRNTEIDAALAEAAATREPVVREVELEESDSVVLLHAVTFPPEGEALGTVAVFHDVTGIRRLEQVRRDFIANASHELRTPLTSIRGFADTLLSAPLSKDEAEPYLEVIVRNADRLANLIDDLLTLSRIESRKVPLRPVEVDVLRLSQTLASDLAPRLAEARIELEVVDKGAVNAFADRQAVEQVVSNLLDNAVKYNDAGGHIEVTVSADDSRVRVRVADDGIGIPDDARGRIFERFYRVDKARSRALGGTGLGLAIVKHLVQAMGGEISVDSELGRGSTFSFHLPRAARTMSEETEAVG